ncbi:hypothetical protein ACF05W_10395 [Streptomyces lydicus]|uniref:allene oxide cyclase barrel-like domain-containing protein n=1 Tax=Streptomyces lydicus TaxID=47763 RepID=UPI0036F8337A
MRRTPMRKIPMRYLSTVVGLTALAAAPLLAAATSTSDSPHTPHTPHTTQQRTQILKLVAKQTGSEDLDLGKKGLSPGDERIISEDLYRDGRKIGDHSVVCTYVHFQPTELQCVGTFALPQGQITGQALLRLPPAPSIDIPVTGGAGAYAAARGYVHTVPAGQTVRRLTFHLTVGPQ